MAKKEALRELQGRLAQRLQAAQTEPRGAAWLAVECAGRPLLFPLQQAGEIFDASAVLPVPHTRGWFAGVANLRGGLHGVVDLAAFLGLRERLGSEAPREGAHLVAFNPNLGLNCALIVDRLSGLRRAGELVAEPAEAGARPPFAGGRWRDGAGRVWQEIELAALANDQGFLAIAG
jgi:twitching motility protein PilI